MALISEFRRFALYPLLFYSAGVISQTVGSASKPYTATMKTTIVRKLADGTSVTRVITSIDARDSNGRTMHQEDMGAMDGGNLKHTMVADPVAHTATTWLVPGKEATRLHTPVVASAVPQGGTLGSSSGYVIGMVAGSNHTQTALPNFSRHPERHFEILGSKTIAGIYAEGSRLTITYPIGFAGNDKPIVTVSEEWISPDLGLAIFTTHDDPRSGLQTTTELTNLDRAEPEPAYFQIPEGYTVRERYASSK